MSYLILIAALVTFVSGQPILNISSNNSKSIPFIISSPVKFKDTSNVRSLDVKCFTDLGKTIYNIIPRQDIQTTELHVTCNTKLESVFRVVGDRPKTAFNCLENATTIIKWLDIFSKNAKTLDLSNNCIKKLDAFPSLQALEILILKHNSIEMIERGAFENLSKLEILDLSYNSLSGDQLTWEIFRGNCQLTDIPNKKGNFSSSLDTVRHCNQLEVKVLNLGHNNIKSLHPNVFKNMYNLRILHLNHNPLSIGDPNIITGIKSIMSLQVLHLSNLGISKIPYSLVEGLRLKALYINNNNFTSVPEELSFLGRSLQYLNINNNPINTLNYDSFIGLSNLKELEVAGMPMLTSVYEGTFSHLRSLDTLILSYNPKLSFIDPFAFRWTSASPSSVKSVYLQENNLKHLSEHLLPWSQLDRLILSGNNWACDCKLRWFLEMTERRNLKVMRESELRCASPNWPNITAFDAYNRPIRNFKCAHSTGKFFLTYTSFTMTQRLTIMGFLAAMFLLLGTILFRCVQRLSQKQSNAIEDLFTLSASLKNDIRYNKLKNKPIYNNI